MTTPVNYHRLAIQEARRAERFYARRGGAGVVAGFRAALLEAEARIAAHLAAWAPEVHGARACRLRKYSYRLIYIEEPTRAFVLAVAHDKRRQGYWVRRLPP